MLLYCKYFIYISIIILKNIGIFCDHDIDDKMNYLIKCKENNVKNIEMESAVFAAYTNYAKCKCKIFSVALCWLGI